MQETKKRAQFYCPAIQNYIFATDRAQVAWELLYTAELNYLSSEISNKIIAVISFWLEPWNSLLLVCDLHKQALFGQFTSFLVSKEEFAAEPKCAFSQKQGGVFSEGKALVWANFHICHFQAQVKKCKIHFNENRAYSFYSGLLHGQVSVEVLPTFTVSSVWGILTYLSDIWHMNKHANCEHHASKN